MAKGFALKLDFKAGFFDRPAIRKAIKPGRRRALSKAGAFVRTRAKSSIRSGGKAGKSSPPGKPPRSHTGDLKRNIFHVYDGPTDSVLVGPVGFPRKRAPENLEHGGTERVRNKLIAVQGKAGRGEGGRFTSGKTFKRYTGTVKYEARPFMAPALDYVKDEIPATFRDIMKGR